MLSLVKHVTFLRPIAAARIRTRSERFVSQPGREISFRHSSTCRRLAVLDAGVDVFFVLADDDDIHFRDAWYRRTDDTKRTGARWRTGRAFCATVTLRLLKPPPCGVVIGAFKNTFVRRNDSHDSARCRAESPRYTPFRRSRCVSMSSCAPAALMICSVASMISGPMPSPYATVTGTFFAVAVGVVKVVMRDASTALSGPTPGRSRPH